MSENNKNLPEQNNWADRNEKPKQWSSRMSDNDALEARRRRKGPQIFNIIGAHIIAAFLVVILLYIIALVVNDNAAVLVSYTVGICVFLVVLYIEGWHAGERDINMMNYGHIPNDKLRGLKCALIAETVGFLLAVLMVAHGYVVLGQRAAGVDERLQTGISIIIPMLYHIFYMPFLGILEKFERISPLFCLIPPFIAPILYHIAYTLGMKNFSILAKFVYKKEEKK